MPDEYLFLFLFFVQTFMIYIVYVGGVWSQVVDATFQKLYHYTMIALIVSYNITLTFTAFDFHMILFLFIYFIDL